MDKSNQQRKPSKCCAFPCEKLCQRSEEGIELPFCEDHAKDEALWQAWYELS